MSKAAQPPKPWCLHRADAASDGSRAFTGSVALLSHRAAKPSGSPGVGVLFLERKPSRCRRTGLSQPRARGRDPQDPGWPLCHCGGLVPQRHPQIGEVKRQEHQRWVERPWLLRSTEFVCRCHGWGSCLIESSPSRSSTRERVLLSQPCH